MYPLIVCIYLSRRKMVRKSCYKILHSPIPLLLPSLVIFSLSITLLMLSLLALEGEGDDLVKIQANDTPYKSVRRMSSIVNDNSANVALSSCKNLAEDDCSPVCSSASYYLLCISVAYRSRNNFRTQLHSPTPVKIAQAIDIAALESLATLPQYSRLAVIERPNLMKTSLVSDELGQVRSSSLSNSRQLHKCLPSQQLGRSLPGGTNSRSVARKEKDGVISCAKDRQFGLPDQYVLLNSFL